MKDTIKTGDVVVLKSGGPIMTVSRAMKTYMNEFFCSWFSEHNLHSGSFHVDMLRHATTDES